MGALFTADLSEDTEISLQFTPTNEVSRVYNVYDSFLGKSPKNTYWTDWGGWYDNPVVNKIELYIGGQFLVPVNSLSDCCVIPFSIYDEPMAGTIYVNVPKHTWLYDEIKTDVRTTISFLSGPKNPGDPSDDVFDEEHWPVRLEVPKFTVKLSDVISGLTKYSTFDFTLFNDDGYFDDLETTNYFNAPSYVRKTWIENPTAGDFITIRYGFVESIKIDDKTVTVSCADLFRTLEEPVTGVVKDKFPTATKNIDEQLPVVYGQVKIPVIEINTGQYVAGENVTSVSGLYDKDGNPVSYSFSGGVITSSAQNVKSALVSGSSNNRIGEVVTDVIENKTNIRYIDSFWDTAETNKYRNVSPRINIAFTDGTVRDAVKNALSSDTVFLIQKNDGRFTLREWNKTYSTFDVEDWMITKFPVKNYADAQKNYASSCLIQYGYDFVEKTHGGTVLYDLGEGKAESAYNKMVRKTFATFLTSATDAGNLGKKLSDRFSVLRETVQVSLGYDTSQINLLDTVRLGLTVNGRTFSKHDTWVVKEIDPAQDILTLEQKEST